jgi:hypothetical protein
MRYEIDDNEVLDHQTGLIWQRAIAEIVTYEETHEYAERVIRETSQAWRVPAIDELASLVDRGRCRPASGFPGMTSTLFWSSSPYVCYTDFVWYVSFGNGDIGISNPADRYGSVRLVRDKS